MRKSQRYAATAGERGLADRRSVDFGFASIVCGDATSPEVVTRLLGDRKPRLMVTGPPYGIELDAEWRDRAGLNGHGAAEPSYMKKRTITGDTRNYAPKAYWPSTGT